jgi:hypothetical protein
MEVNNSGQVAGRMMKKSVLSLMMAGILAFGGSVCAFAEEETESVDEGIYLDYSMIVDSGEESQWFSFFDVFDLYLPVDWTDEEVTEEEQEQGIYCKIVDEETGNAIVISYIDAGDADLTLDDAAAIFSESYEVEQWTINDIPTLVFGEVDTEDSVSSIGLAAVGTQGGYYQIVLAVADTENIAWAENVICSFCAHEEAEDNTEIETEIG